MLKLQKVYLYYEMAWLLLIIAMTVLKITFFFVGEILTFAIRNWLSTVWFLTPQNYSTIAEKKESCRLQYGSIFMKTAPDCIINHLPESDIFPQWQIVPLFTYFFM
jgi:hypothetical protein